MKFNHLNVPETWQHYWSKYPEGYTILEALLNWVAQVDSMVDNQNVLNDRVTQFRQEMDEFIDRFNPRLREEVARILNEWLDDGTLAEIINTDVLNMKADQHGLGVSVKRFGVTMDGVTDDTAAWQAAIDANVPLLMGEGTSVVSRLVIKPTTRIYGQGIFKSIFKTTAGQSVIDGSDEQALINVELKDFAIEGNGADNQRGLDLKYFTNNSILSNIRVEGCQYGVKITKSWYAQFDRLRLRNNITRNLEIHSPTGAEQCNALNFNECTFMGAVYNVYIHGPAPSSGIHFSGCTIEGARRSGVYARACSPLSFDNCYFEKNFLDGAVSVTPTLSTPIDADIDTFNVRDNVSFTNCYFSRKNDFLPSTEKIGILVGESARLNMENCVMQCNTSAYIDYDIYSLSQKEPFIKNVSQDGYAVRLYGGTWVEYPVAHKESVNLAFTTDQRLSFPITKRGRHIVRFVPYDNHTGVSPATIRLRNMVTNEVILSRTMPTSFQKGVAVELDIGNQTLGNVVILETSTVSDTAVIGYMYVVRRDTK